MTEFEYQKEKEYDSHYKKHGHSFRCFSEKKFKEMYSDGNFRIIGELGKPVTGSDGDAHVGVVTISGSEYDILKNSRRRHKAKHYICVGEGLFIIIYSSRKTPVILALSLILIAALGVGGYLMFHEQLEPETQDDPNATKKQTEYTLYGHITKAEANVEGAYIALTKGNETVSSTHSDKNGYYEFTELKSGLYTVQVQTETQTMMESVVIEGIDKTLDFELSENSFSVYIDTEKLRGSLGVSGLSRLAEKYAEPGKNVSLSFVAETYESEDVDAETALIQAICGELEMTYYNFSIQKTVEDETGAYTEEIQELDDAIEVIVAYDSSTSADTCVFRAHDGEAIEFTKLENIATGSYTDATCYVDTDKIYIDSNKFSRYGIGKANTGKKTSGSVLISYSPTVVINKGTGNIVMRYDNTDDSSNDVTVSLIVESNDKEYVVATSGRVRVGYSLNKMTLSRKYKSSLSAGYYKGSLKVEVIEANNGSAGMHVELPVTIQVID